MTALRRPGSPLHARHPSGRQVLGPTDVSCRAGVGSSIGAVKRQRSDVERPEARGAVVGRWFLPVWWSDVVPPRRPDVRAERLAQFAAVVAAAALVVLVVSRLGG